MNRVILIGRLSRDPELRTTPNNISVARFSLAVSRPFSSQNNGDPGTDFINCVVWRRQAENLVKYCHKGSQIAVEGRIQTGSYTTQDGTKRYTTEVLCDSITFLGSKADNQGGATFVDNNYGNYQAPMNNFEQPINQTQDIPQDNYNTNEIPTTDLTEDPFKDFGEEISLSDDDLPF